jgi:hypothetical protein
LINCLDLPSSHFDRGLSFGMIALVTSCLRAVLQARDEVKLPFEVPQGLHERFSNPRVMSERGTERSSKNEEFVKAAC